MKKCFFQTYKTAIFHFFCEAFEIFIKTHVLLYFYDWNRSSHQRCSIKKLFLKFSQYSQENTCVGVFFAGLHVWLQKRFQHMHFPVNTAKFWKTSANGYFQWYVHYYITSNKKCYFLPRQIVVYNKTIIITHFLKDHMKCIYDPSFFQLLIEKSQIHGKNEEKPFYQTKDYYFLF